MARKESLGDFVKKLPRMFPQLSRKVLTLWNQNTLITMADAQTYAPVDKGTLQGSARAIKAKVTTSGIKSAFVFAVPYARRLELDTSLNIRTDVNPRAQSGYASRAVEENKNLFVEDLKKAVSQVWQAI